MRAAIAGAHSRNRCLVLANAAVAGWRGSYCFIPSDRATIFRRRCLPVQPDRAALREGWRKLLPRAIADPLNPQSWRAGAAIPCRRWRCPAPRSPAGIGPMPHTPRAGDEWHSRA
jgi:enterochelin esterase family protein